MDSDVKILVEEVNRWRVSKSYPQEPLPAALRSRINTLRENFEDKVILKTLNLHPSFFKSRKKKAKKNNPQQTNSSPFLKIESPKSSKPTAFVVLSFSNGSELKIYQ